MADDDIDFIRAMQGVRRLDNKSAPPAIAKRSPNHTLRAEIRQRALYSATTLSEPDHAAEYAISQSEYAGQSNQDSDSELFFLGQGVQKKILRDLKKGQRYPIRATLDLHGLTQAQAQREIDRTMLDFNYTGIACLHIIHGKGQGSAQGPVLKNFTASYLKNLPQVRAYCSAPVRDGGTGALYVLLRGR